MRARRLGVVGVAVIAVVAVAAGGDAVLASGRRTQTVRVGIEGNGALCRGLPRSLYHVAALEQELVGSPSTTDQEDR